MILGNLNHSGNLFTSFFVRCCARDFYICRPLTLKLRIVKFVKSLFLPPPPPGPLMLKTYHIQISIIMNWYVFIISNPKYLTRCWNVLETNLVFKTLVSHWRVPSRLFFCNFKEELLCDRQTGKTTVTIEYWKAYGFNPDCRL